VDGFIVETFSDLEELRAAMEAVRSVSDLPIIAQMTVGTDGKTYYGTDPATFGPLIEAMGASVIGVNCSVGPHGVLDAVEQLARVTTIPISAQPNAGLPREVEDRKIYMASPEYMASYARRMVEAGARFVGGCCGTTPEHIKAIVGFVQSVSPRHIHHRSTAPTLAVAQDPVPMAERSRLGAKLARGEFVTTVEIVPPKGVDPRPMYDQVRELKAAGVDAVNVPDGPRAQSRMGALLSGLLIQREVGIEAVVHYACRDRNLLGMLSDLLGAAASDLHNLLIITGDPPKMGPYPDATAVFDIDSIGLTNLVSRLNRGLDPGGNALGSTTKFVVGVGVNPAAPDMDRELKRFAWKVEAGAEFAVTQPVFDIDQLDRFLEQVQSFRIPIVAGIWPLISLRNAEFLANEVPGVSVPDAIVRRMRLASARGKEEGLAEGVLIAQEMLAAIRPRLQGVQVAAPLGRANVAIEVIGNGAS
jgi:homocysteine S-methyltransferase